MATDKFTQSAKPVHKMPNFSTEAALSLLWLKAANELHTHELEWFATHAATYAGDNASQLSDTLHGISCLIRDDGDGGHFANADAASSLIHGIAVQLSGVAGMANIAADATIRAQLAGGRHGN